MRPFWKRFWLVDEIDQYNKFGTYTYHTAILHHHVLTVVVVLVVVEIVMMLLPMVMVMAKRKDNYPVILLYQIFQKICNTLNSSNVQPLSHSSTQKKTRTPSILSFTHTHTNTCNYNVHALKKYKPKDTKWIVVMCQLVHCSCSSCQYVMVQIRDGQAFLG